MTPPTRHFLFLQGPHGPFFRQLARLLMRAGSQVSRVGFNAGDAAFWHGLPGYIPFRGTQEAWPDKLEGLLESGAITDLVLYGDTRPIHAVAIAAARRHGLIIHVFEEGYLRPYWITYERGGANGNSRLTEMSLPEIAAHLQDRAGALHEAPARWGDLRQHIFYGMLYHFCVLALNRGYPGFRPHRKLSVRQEFRLYLKRLLGTPVIALHRLLATRRILRSGAPYHLVLLQLEHDASFQNHSDFSDMAAFLELCISSFARAAPRHHDLVFKAHPLEDGRAPIRRDIRRLARAHEVAARVHFVAGGKLARLLDSATSAITVNSTAAQQALWRGLPVKTLGRAIYDKPGIVSPQSLGAFFGAPAPGDRDAYRQFRQFLLQSSQIPGGFYSARGRRQLRRRLVDIMLDPRDPYERLARRSAVPSQQLRIVTPSGSGKIPPVS